MCNKKEAWSKTGPQGHYKPRNHANGAQYAASAGVPIPSLLVPLSGIISILGAISIIIGYKAKWGAWLIVLFLIPVTIMMHNFWTITDPMQKQLQMAMFMKNISMLGAAFLIGWFGAGPYSIDANSVK